MFGDAGNDKMFGGSGDDEMHGGTGSDEMRGGTGNRTQSVRTTPTTSPSMSSVFLFRSTTIGKKS